MQRPSANRLQLLCLPCAGASAAIFGRWRALVPSWLEVVPVELPGRGRRSSEAFATDLRELGEQLAASLLPKLTAPYALFGHSMGAVLAFEVASLLSRRGRAPRSLFVSGSASPAQRSPARYATLDSDEALIAEMRRLGGTRNEVFESAELLELTLPILRADFRLCAGYRYQPSPTLDGSLHVFGGLRDEVDVTALESWRVHTRGAFTLDVLDGGHFFIHSHESRLLELIAQHAGVGAEARAS